jgi:hypothetical protein
MPDDGLFRKESLEHITNPQQLDSYIVVTHTGWWFLLAALLVLMTSVFIWAAEGSIPETINAKALVVDGTHLVAYLPVSENNLYLVGKLVTVTPPRGQNSYDARVYAVSQTPLSRQEVASTVSSDWLLSNLMTSNYADRVTIISNQSLPVATGTLCDVNILLGRIKPIQYILQ